MKYFRFFSALFFLLTVSIMTLRTWGLHPPFPNLRPILALEQKKEVAFEFPKSVVEGLNLLPSHGVITVIFDKAYLPLGDQEALLFQTQNTFTPLLLNPYSGEDIALVLCSNDKIANQRLIEMRYEWLRKLSPGKGIARILP